MRDVKIYIAGRSDNKFLDLPDMYEKYFVDVKHDGDHIDDLNPWYSELTVLYHLWKHATADIVGLCHYRRYFVYQGNCIMNQREIERILTDHDIIMYKWPFESAVQAMGCSHKGPELKFAVDLIEVFHGKEMADFFRKKLAEKGVYEGNMFICRKELIDEYCEFLFGLLQKFDEGHKFRIPRIDGYIAEYLFGPWMEWKQKKIYECKRITFDRKLTTVLRGHA